MPYPAIWQSLINVQSTLIVDYLHGQNGVLTSTTDLVRLSNEEARTKKKKTIKTYQEWLQDKLPNNDAEQDVKQDFFKLVCEKLKTVENEHNKICEEYKVAPGQTKILLEKLNDSITILKECYEKYEFLDITKLQCKTRIGLKITQSFLEHLSLLNLKNDNQFIDRLRFFPHLFSDIIAIENNFKEVNQSYYLAIFTSLNAVEKQLSKVLKEKYIESLYKENGYNDIHKQFTITQGFIEQLNKEYVRPKEFKNNFTDILDKQDLKEIPNAEQRIIQLSGFSNITHEDAKTLSLGLQFVYWKNNQINDAITKSQNSEKNLLLKYLPELFENIHDVEIALKHVDDKNNNHAYLLAIKGVLLKVETSLNQELQNYLGSWSWSKSDSGHHVENQHLDICNYIKKINLHLIHNSPQNNNNNYPSFSCLNKNLSDQEKGKEPENDEYLTSEDEYIPHASLSQSDTDTEKSDENSNSDNEIKLEEAKEESDIEVEYEQEVPNSESDENSDSNNEAKLEAPEEENYNKTPENLSTNTSYKNNPKEDQNKNSPSASKALTELSVFNNKQVNSEQQVYTIDQIKNLKIIKALKFKLLSAESLTENDLENLDKIDKLTRDNTNSPLVKGRRTLSKYKTDLQILKSALEDNDIRYKNTEEDRPTVKLRA